MLWKQTHLAGVLENNFNFDYVNTDKLYKQVRLQNLRQIEENKNISVVHWATPSARVISRWPIERLMNKILLFWSSHFFCIFLLQCPPQWTWYGHGRMTFMPPCSYSRMEKEVDQNAHHNNYRHHLLQKIASKGMVTLQARITLYMNKSTPILPQQLQKTHKILL